MINPKYVLVNTIEERIKNTPNKIFFIFQLLVYLNDKGVIA